jgi:putative SOS response-associated peptidase YedK
MGFFEWKAIKGQKAKQPYGIAMKDGKPFASAASGRTGKTRATASGSGTFTTGCHWSRMTTAAGSVMSPIRATLCGHSPPNPADVPDFDAGQQAEER